MHIPSWAARRRGEAKHLRRARVDVNQHSATTRASISPLTLQQLILNNKDPNLDSYAKKPKPDYLTATGNSTL